MDSGKTTNLRGQNLSGRLNSDELVIEGGIDGRPVWKVGEVVTPKQYDDARVTLKFAIVNIKEQLTAGPHKSAKWKSKARKALVLKQLALDVLDRRFGSDDVENGDADPA